MLDKATGWLYIADTGGKRILRVNTKTGSATGNLTATNEPLVAYKAMTGATKEVFVSTGLTQPSGIDFSNGRLVVTDYSTGDIIIYDATGSTGVELKRFKSSSGTTGIAGVKISPDNFIWYVDSKANTLVKVIPGTVSNVDDYSVTNSVNIFPNPASDKVYVTFYNTQSRAVELKVNDAQGREVYSNNISSNTGINQVELNSNLFSPGIYFVNLVIDGQSQYKKLVIQ